MCVFVVVSSVSARFFFIHVYFPLEVKLFLLFLLHLSVPVVCVSVGPQPMIISFIVSLTVHVPVIILVFQQ